MVEITTMTTAQDSLPNKWNISRHEYTDTVIPFLGGIKFQRTIENKFEISEYSTDRCDM